MNKYLTINANCDTCINKGICNKYVTDINCAADVDIDGCSEYSKQSNSDNGVIMDYIYQIGRCTHITQSSVGKYPILEDANHYAWYDSFESAEKCVLHNLGDIHETIYDWVIIEKYEFNVSNAVATERWFYMFNNSTKKYEQIPEPDFVKHSCNLI